MSNYDTSFGNGCDECGNTHGDSHSATCSHQYDQLNEDYFAKSRSLERENAELRRQKSLAEQMAAITIKQACEERDSALAEVKRLREWASAIPHAMDCWAVVHMRGDGSFPVGSCTCYLSRIPVAAALAPAPAKEEGNDKET